MQEQHYSTPNTTPERIRDMRIRECLHEIAEAEQKIRLARKRLRYWRSQ